MPPLGAGPAPDRLPSAPHAAHPRPRVNLLSTRTTSFLELVGNGRTYEVPPYQRDYSWEEEQWEDLWNDLLDLRGRPDDSHYMGTLVVEGVSDRQFRIIDGQQRLATLSILGLAVIERLRSLAAGGVDAAANAERANALRSRFIGEKDPASLVESSKLRLNATDDGFYQDYLVQLRPPVNPRGLPRSNRLLWDCFAWFRDRIAEQPAVTSDGERLAQLLSEAVARQLVFILVTVDDDVNAYTVFETLNARGPELSTTDLLKNYLFSRVPVAADREALQRRWHRLIATVRQEKFPEFLRYHLLCEHSRIRSQRLFKIVRDRVRTSAEVFALIDALEPRAELYVALGDPAHPYWIDRPECRPHVAEIELFAVRAMTPLLFAAWERFGADDFRRTLRLVSVISFRFSVVGRINTNELESGYHRGAKAILDGAATGPAGVFDVLRPLYVEDDQFERDFGVLAMRTYGRSKKRVRYVLACLEADQSGRACDPWTDPFTIEHVLPENPTGGWTEAVPRERVEGLPFRLGNLTPVERPINAAVGNSAYAEKLLGYAGSGYALTASIPAEHPEEWTAAVIDARQRRMAERAVHLWRSDVA